LTRRASFESRITLRGFAIFGFPILTLIMAGPDPPAADFRILTSIMAGQDPPSACCDFFRK